MRTNRFGVFAEASWALALVLFASTAGVACMAGEITGYHQGGAADAGTQDQDPDAAIVPGQPDAAIVPGQPDAAIVPQPDAAVPPPPLPTISFNAYHSQSEIAAYLRDVADARPQTVTFEVLGESYEGREIAYVIINATGQANPPTIFVNGTHHGDEKSSTESTLAIIDHLLRSEGDPDVATVLGTYAIYVLPLVNPDGHAAGSRWDVFGRDPNRDYAFPWRSEADSFDIQEIALIHQLQQAAEFRAALAYHAGLTEVIWPWGHSGSQTEDHDVFNTLAQKCATAMGFDRWLQAYYEYPAEGDYTDYAYWKHGTFALTVEISWSKTPSPSSLPHIAEIARDGAVAFMKGFYDYEHGSMLIERETERHYGTVGSLPVVDGERLE